MVADRSPGISFSVVCFDTSAAELDRLLRSLCLATRRLRRDFSFAQADLFLINNSPKSSLESLLGKETRSRLATEGLTLHQIEGHGNVGYGRGHNLALRTISSDYHLILNPDIELDEEALFEGINYLTRHEEVVLVSPRAYTERARRQYLCKRYPSVLTFLIRGFFPVPLRRLFTTRLASFEMRDLPEDRPSTDIPICSGCFMLCRTSDLLAVKGFDPGYFLYFEDFDLSLRLSARGSLAYVPAMSICHAGGHAAGKGWKHIGMFLRSGRRFFATHGWRWFAQAGPAPGVAHRE